jgi:hypothetical protein
MRQHDPSARAPWVKTASGAGTIIGSSRMAHDAKRLFKRLLELKRVGSEREHALCYEAALVLEDLPKDFDQALLRRVILWFARQASGQLWRVLHHIRREDSATVRTALKQVARRRFEARFLVAASDGAEDEHEAFITAAKVVWAASELSDALESDDKPLNAATRRLMKACADEPRLLAAARKTVSEDRDAEMELDESLFAILAGVLAVAGDAASVRVLKDLAQAMLAEKRDWKTQQLARILGASGNAAAAKIAERITGELEARAATSPVGRWLEEVGVRVPAKGYWSITVSLQTGRGYDHDGRPELQLQVEAGPPPLWRITLRGEGAKCSDWCESRTFDNHFKLAAPASPLDFAAIVAASAAKLETKWSPTSIDVTTTSVSNAKRQVKKWAAAQLSRG